MKHTDDANVYADLDAAKDARRLLREKLKASTQTLERARRASAVADEKLHAHEAADEADQSAQARRLEELLTAGGPTADLPPPLDDSAARAVVSLRLNASITAKALKSIEASHRQLVDELAAADNVVDAAAKRALIHEGEKIAAEIDMHEAKTMELRQTLLGLRGDDRFRPVTKRLTSNRIERALRFAVDTEPYAPTLISDLVGGLNGTQSARLPLVDAAEKRWFARLAELIDDEPSQSDDRAA